MDENAVLKSRISQLAGAISSLRSGRVRLTGFTGHINRTRNVQPNHVRGGGHQATPYSSSRSQSQGYVYSGRINRHGHESRPTPHRHHAPHRNRTLVFNNQGIPDQPATSGDEEKGGLGGLDQDKLPKSTDESLAPTSTSWVSKRDRHNQLINATLFEKHRGLQEADGSPSAQQSVSTEVVKAETTLPTVATELKPAATHVLEIDGSRFQVCNDGSDDDAHPTPPRVVIHGIEFLRSKRGNLYRSGAVKERRTLTAKAEPCKQFTRTGHCKYGPKCRFTHDPSKVAVCREFLKSGRCPNGAHCDLSHSPSYERVPACSHFIRGLCSKPDCRYAHVRVNPGADVCKAFAELGYCDKGVGCEQRHVFECPNYAKDGKCPNRPCQLPHVDRAGQLRKQAGGNTDPDPDSSKEPGATEVGGDKADLDTDFSSDDLDEEMVLGTASTTSQSLLGQIDFVRF